MAAPSRAIEVAEVIDNAPVSGFQTATFVLCALVVMLDGFDAQAIAFVAAPIARELNMPVTSFGPIFGAGTLGLALGALLLPPFADRFGRRRLIILATLIFGVFSLATVWAHSFASLALMRFLTGIGVGAAVPNIVPLTSEHAPKRIRAWLITLVTVTWPLGAVLGGLISSKLIPLYGWQSVFYLGGIAPLVMVALLLPWLPESTRFMVSRNQEPGRIAALLRRISPSLSYAPGDRFVLAEENLGGFSVRHLFTSGRAVVTVLLWTAFFMNFLLLFFIFNWLPTLMQQAGMPIGRAIIATVLFNLGGIIGGVLLGRLMDKFGSYVVLGIAYACATVFVGAIGMLGGHIPLLLTVTTLAGFCTVGTQAASNALAASLYPTSVRSTGVGWAYGIGRIGSIVGPVLGGIFLTLHWGMRDLFLIAAIPLVCTTTIIVVLGRCRAAAET
jgi:AAHS family 4-hydroxybenzoate transporter-like MFS transporter